MFTGYLFKTLGETFMYIQGMRGGEDGMPTKSSNPKKPFLPPPLTCLSLY